MSDGIIRVRRIRRFVDENPETQEETINTVDETYVGDLGESEMESESSTELSNQSETRWDRFGRWCIYAVALLAPLLFFPSTIAPVESAKTVGISIIALFGAISFLASSIEKRSFAYPRSRISIGVVGLLAASLVSLLFSTSRPISLYGNLIEPTAFIPIAAFGLIFFLSSYFLRREHMQRLYAMVGIGMGVASLYAILQSFGTFVLPWAFTKQIAFTTFGSPTAWAVMSAMVLAVTTVVPWGTSRRGKLAVVALDILLVVSLLILNYPFIWVSLAFLMTMISAARFVNRQPLGLPLVVGIAAVFLALVSSHIPQIAKQPVIEVRPDASSSFTIAKKTLFSKRAAVGSGPATYVTDFAMYKPQGINQSQFWSTQFSQGYNAFFTMVTEMGLLGLIALAFLVWVFIKVLLTTLQDTETFPIASAMLFIFISLAFYPIFHIELIMLGLGLGAIMALTRKTRLVSLETVSPSRSFLAFMAGTLLIALSLASMYFLGQKYVAASDYRAAVVATGNNNIDGALSNIRGALTWDGESDVYFRGASQIFLVQAQAIIAQGGSASEPAFQTAISNAVQAALRATELNPKNPTNWSNAGSIYEALIGVVGGSDRYALGYYAEAVSRDPVNPLEPLNAARTIMSSARLMPANEKDEAKSLLAEAEKYINKALELKPDYAPARYLLAKLYLQEGNIQAAVERTEEIKQQNPLDAGVAFQLGFLYYDNNQFDQARTELERAVALSPDYANARYFLGLVYDKKGMESEALEQFKKIEELNKDNQEIKQIIKNLESGRGALDSIVPPAPPPESRSSTPVSDR